MPDPYRLRLRLASGAEMEASGDPEFIRAEREAFLALDNPAQAEPLGGGAQQGRHGNMEPAWNSIIEARGSNIQLRAKLGGDRTNRDACLVLLAASQKLLNTSKPTAAQLARWLRASGYPVQRVDRAISDALHKGEILASGSRRGRRYELTGPGRLKAYLLANQLGSVITGTRQ